MRLFVNLKSILFVFGKLYYESNILLYNDQNKYKLKVTHNYPFIKILRL